MYKKNSFKHFALCWTSDALKVDSVLFSGWKMLVVKTYDELIVSPNLAQVDNRTLSDSILRLRMNKINIIKIHFHEKGQV